MLRTHNEAAADEIFVGNTQRNSGRLEWLKAVGVRTARLGKIANDIDGNKLPEYYAPIFINRSDAERYNDVMMTATFGADWRRNQ